MASKALLIGIRYKGRAFENQPAGSAQLDGSHQDVRNIEELIMKKYGYKRTDITLMMDDGVHKAPTRANIISEIKQLVKGAKTGDRFFFHFSGHGSQVVDTNGDEPDGYDEAIWPMDFKLNDDSSYIIDDDLRELMVNALPPGCRLTALFDSCHSGTILDLPNEVKGTPKSKTVSLPTVDHHPSPPTAHPIPVQSPLLARPPTPTIGTPPRTIFKLLSDHMHTVAPPVQTTEEAVHGILGLPYLAQGGIGKRARGAARNSTERPSLLVLEPNKKEGGPAGAIVTSWAACADSESAYEGTTGAGAMVQAWIKALKEPVEHTYATLLQSLSDSLNEFCVKYNAENPEDPPISQVPQLGSLHALTMANKFTL
ncbi:peptidase C14 [Auriculariales sp. MPI-PUGE-AT-0066]|nr:peptidase C14 [Auriculariales sp. MPI-PUGE-AT-0066]